MPRRRALLWGESGDVAFASVTHRDYHPHQVHPEAFSVLVACWIASITDTIKLTDCLSSTHRAMLTAAGVASAAVVAAVHWDDSPLVAIALGALVLVASLLTAIDFAVHRLPNVIVGPLALAVTLALLVGGAVSQDWGRVGFAVGVGVAASALFFVGNIIAGIGMGDVKYAYPVFATAAWFGAVPLQVTLLGMALSAAGVAIVVLVMGGGRGTAMAYGPYMSFGLVLGLVVAGLG